jgi:hypothetical protein
LPNNISTAEDLNNYFLTQSPFKESDIDLFLYGETNRATVKNFNAFTKKWQVDHIQEVVTRNLRQRNASYCFAAAVGTKVVTIVTEYPNRHVQIICNSKTRETPVKIFFLFSQFFSQKYCLVSILTVSALPLMGIKCGRCQGNHNNLSGNPFQSYTSDYQTLQFG